MPRLAVCKLCGQLTTGSTGAAGIYWPNLCQFCKNNEDAALAATIAQQAKVLDAALSMLASRET